jgi:hypothetical protein
VFSSSPIGHWFHCLLERILSLWLILVTPCYTPKKNP